MKIDETKARRRLAGLYEKWAGVYAAAAGMTKKDYSAACFRALAAMYRRAAVEVTIIPPVPFRPVDWRGVSYLLKESER